MHTHPTAVVAAALGAGQVNVDGGNEDLSAERRQMRGDVIDQHSNPQPLCLRGRVHHFHEM